MKEIAMSPTSRISAYILDAAYIDIPPEAVKTAKSGIMDYVASTIAGIPDESAMIARDVVKEMGGNPNATVWGSGFKTSAPLAAMANGTAAHALDCDDTNIVMMAHPSIQLLPALFALGEQKRVSGEGLILAYIIGFEIGAVLGRAMNPELVGYGWFPVGPLGALMQTAACAKLVELNQAQIENALGIAANLASGLRCNNGTMAKPLLPGVTASNAIQTVLMASRGMTVSQNAIEGKFGFFENFTRKKVSVLEQSTAVLGDLYEIYNPDSTSNSIQAVQVPIRPLTVRLIWFSNIRSRLERFRRSG
jgi:2-methylcitrate dehydratase PrpD